MNPQADKTSSEHEALIGLFTSLLHPLMPLALERGISAREVSDAVRRAYVQALEARMAGQDRKLSDARLALVAGLTRSEVKLFRDPHQKIVKVPEGRSAEQLERVATILSVWHTHPKFSGAYGLALDLDLKPVPNSPRRSWSELIETACPGTDPESILDQLIAADSVEVVDQTTVRCQSRVALFGKSDDVTVNRIDRAAKCLEAAVRSFAYNLQQSEPANGYFERMVTSDHPLSPKSRDEFALAAQVRGEEYVVELDTWLSKNTHPDRSPNGKRYGVGVYFFEEAQVEHQTVVPGGADLASLGIAGKQGRVEEIDVLAPPDSIKALSKKPGE